MFRRIGMAAIAVAAVFGGCVSQPPALDPLPPISEYEPSDWDLERYRSDLEGMARDYNIVDPGEFSIIRWINPGDAPQVIADCLAAQGYMVTINADGWEISLPPGQDVPFNRARYQCAAQYPVRNDIVRPYTDAEVEVLYRHLEEEYLPCIEAKGYPGLVLPSKKTFKSEAQQGRWAFDPWTQFNELYPELTAEERVEVVDSCPQAPPGFRSYSTE